jgi:hypothetical protein
LGLDLKSQEHKWHRALELFSVTPRERIAALLQEGVPDSVRPALWSALIRSGHPAGAAAVANAGASGYRKFLLMPDNKATEQIKLDLARTLTHHQMFEEKGGEGQQKLLRVLKAYSYFNPAVGYCQGMSYLAAILLTVMGEEEAFYGLCRVVSGMEGYFVPSMWELLEDAKIFKRILGDQMSDINDHLQDNGILPLMFICKWFMTLFSQLPWTTVLRVFDFYLYEGKVALFRFGYAILAVHHDELLALRSIDVLLPYLLEPASKKLLAHVLVPHAMALPMENYLRVATAALRDGQEILLQCAAAGTPHSRANNNSTSSVTAAVDVSRQAKQQQHQQQHQHVSGAAAANASTNNNSSSFFERFLSSISTPVRSAVKRRVETTGEGPRVVATPPNASATRRNLNFGPPSGALSPLSPGASRLNSPRANNNNTNLKAQSTPPMFEGMKKRVRQVEANDENETSATELQKVLQSPLKLRAL